ncbi:hypothetical protein ACQ9A5_25035, partial [Escherichia coli]|uniref:hypothetical protein n=1 Tax=Escherichia coli TaxID=562 RepID=UPI003D35FFA9
MVVGFGVFVVGGVVFGCFFLVVLCVVFRWIGSVWVVLVVFGLVVVVLWFLWFFGVSFWCVPGECVDAPLPTMALFVGVGM